MHKERALSGRGTQCFSGGIWVCTLFFILFTVARSAIDSKRSSKVLRAVILELIEQGLESKLTIAFCHDVLNGSFCQIVGEGKDCSNLLPQLLHLSDQALNFCSLLSCETS